MLNQTLKDYLVSRVLPQVQAPAQYLGGEWNMVRKSHAEVAGTLCLAFPDTYTVGMSHHGLQVLYTLMNERTSWACERAFTPHLDMEAQLRQHALPLYSLETFTPLVNFDVLGFTLQYEICYSNLLTMLDLGGVPLQASERTLEHPLVIAGGPCAQNPEPLAPFIDVFVTGDGEPSLPAICATWRELKLGALSLGKTLSMAAARQLRSELLVELARRLPFAYVPQLYAANYSDTGQFLGLEPLHADVPETIEPAVIDDLDAIELPTRPIVPFVECIHDRIAIEIMRGCPWQCRFCQSTVIKRPLRLREVETIVSAALATYHNTGCEEISLLSLSTSDYPYFEQLVRRMQEVFHPLGVRIVLPSLRVNEQLRTMAALMSEDRRGLTLAPEVARDDMREQIRKKIKNDDLYEGCRQAFRHGWQQVKLYFLCGLPGERDVDLDGIVDMAETIARIGKEEFGKYAKVTASVSNFVPKAHTPYQWNAIQTRDYFKHAHKRLWKRRRLGSVNIKCHDVETSMLEGLLSRGDRRTAAILERAWRQGARLDTWFEHENPARYWQAAAELEIDLNTLLHQPYELHDRLPWDHLNVRKGRVFLEREQQKAALQLAELAQ